MSTSDALLHHYSAPDAVSRGTARLDGCLQALSGQRSIKKLRVVLEVGHTSWLDPEVIRRLEAAGVALCPTDWRAAVMVCCG